MKCRSLYNVWSNQGHDGCVSTLQFAYTAACDITVCILVHLRPECIERLYGQLL